MCVFEEIVRHVWSQNIVHTFFIKRVLDAHFVSQYCWKSEELQLEVEPKGYLIDIGLRRFKTNQFNCDLISLHLVMRFKIELNSLLH